MSVLQTLKKRDGLYCSLQQTDKDTQGKGFYCIDTRIQCRIWTDKIWIYRSFSENQFTNFHFRKILYLCCIFLKALTPFFMNNCC